MATKTKAAATQSPKAAETAEAANETLPTPAEAQGFFADNPGLFSVVTTEGILLRDGSFQ